MENHQKSTHAKLSIFTARATVNIDSLKVCKTVLVPKYLFYVIGHRLNRNRSLREYAIVALIFQSNRQMAFLDEIGFAISTN